MKECGCKWETTEVNMTKGRGNPKKKGLGEMETGSEGESHSDPTARDGFPGDAAGPQLSSDQTKGGDVGRPQDSGGQGLGDCVGPDEEFPMGAGVTRVRAAAVGGDPWSQEGSPLMNTLNRGPRQASPARFRGRGPETDIHMLREAVGETVGVVNHLQAVTSSDPWGNTGCCGRNSSSC